MNTEKVKNYINNEQLLELNSSIQNSCNTLFNSMTSFYDVINGILSNQEAEWRNHKIFFIPSKNALLAFKDENVIHKEDFLTNSSFLDINSEPFITDVHICYDVDKKSCLWCFNTTSVYYKDLVKFAYELIPATQEQRDKFNIPESDSESDDDSNAILNKLNNVYNMNTKSLADTYFNTLNNMSKNVNNMNNNKMSNNSNTRDLDISFINDLLDEI